MEIAAKEKNTAYAFEGWWRGILLDRVISNDRAVFQQATRGS